MEIHLSPSGPSVSPYPVIQLPRKRKSAKRKHEDPKAVFKTRLGGFTHRFGRLQTKQIPLRQTSSSSKIFGSSKRISSQPKSTIRDLSEAKIQGCPLPQRGLGFYGTLGWFLAGCRFILMVLRVLGYFLCSSTCGTLLNGFSNRKLLDASENDVS